MAVDCWTPKSTQYQGSKASLAWGRTYGRSCTRGTTDGWPEVTFCSCDVRGRPKWRFGKGMASVGVCKQYFFSIYRHVSFGLYMAHMYSLSTHIKNIGWLHCPGHGVDVCHPDVDVPHGVAILRQEMDAIHLAMVLMFLQFPMPVLEPPHWHHELPLTACIVIWLWVSTIAPFWLAWPLRILISRIHAYVFARLALQCMVCITWSTSLSSQKWKWNSWYIYYMGWLVSF